MKQEKSNRRRFNCLSILFILGCLIFVISCDKDEPKMSSLPDESVIATGQNGIVAHKKALAIGEKMFSQKGVDTIKVVDGFHVIKGLGISNCIVIEGKTGLIVADTGDHVEEGRDRLKEIRKISDKPIKAIIYSHWHYSNGTKAFTSDGNDVTIIGHEKLDFNKTNAIGLLAPTVLRRAAFQMGMYLPDEGPDAAPFGSIKLTASESGYIPPNRTVSEGEILEIDGVRMQFYTRYRSDTDCSLIVYFPDFHTVFNNHSLPIFPNLYSLRGQSFRDPKTWIEGIDLMLDIDPEHLVVVHGDPTSGKDAVRTRLMNYRDTMQFLYDQTVRGMNLGLTPNELVKFVKLPEHLKKDPNLQQVYVTEDAVVRQIHNGLVGWFDGESVNISRLSPAAESSKIVQGFGGRDAVFKQAEQAFNAKEYQWAAILATHLINVDPEDKDAKQLKANILRRLGQLSVASNSRNWYITQARVLEGKIDLSVPPGTLLTKAKIMEAPEFFVELFRVRIDPEKSREADKTLGFNFTDINKKVSLHVRRGVVIYKDKYPEQGVDIEVAMTSEAWAKIILKELGFLKALITGKVKITKGGKMEFKSFMGMFDQG